MTNNYDKLPKWAQNEIKLLKRKCQELEDEVSTLWGNRPPSNTYANPFDMRGDRKIYLNDYESVVFVGKEENKVVVRCNLAGYITIDIGSGVICPGARNVFYVLDRHNKSGY